jgi:hypothetical protein
MGWNLHFLLNKENGLESLKSSWEQYPGGGQKIPTILSGNPYCKKDLGVHLKLALA